ncbi:MAG TPA: endonuclease/exonuclease/phosphatase family protein [Anaerolineales bacterium]|nr:endonuclease/exonuclease/phosphatase family protein [Anaerolineales bacterium]
MSLGAFPGTRLALKRRDEVIRDARQTCRAFFVHLGVRARLALERLPRASGLPGLKRRLLEIALPPAAPRLWPAPALISGPGGVMTVLSANLWHDWPRYRRLPERLEAMARLMEDEGVDVALLQEVARTPALHADRWLAGRLRMSSAYSRANGHEKAIGFEEGLAILSRYPLRSPRAEQLRPSLVPWVRRMALGAEIDGPAGRMAAYSVHLGLIPRLNAAQLEHLLGWIGASARGLAAVIAGDFNAHENAPQMRRARAAWLDVFRHLHPLVDGTTHVLRWPWGAPLRRHRLDYVFLHAAEPRWRVLEARTIEGLGHASDHRAVLARLKACE